jgi:hypothetical protein
MDVSTIEGPAILCSFRCWNKLQEAYAETVEQELGLPLKLVQIVEAVRYLHFRAKTDEERRPESIARKMGINLEYVNFALGQ